MNVELAWWEKAVIVIVVMGSMGLGFSIGLDTGTSRTTKALTNEAVREKAGQWVAGEAGEPVFKWKVCVAKEDKK
jgi:hypothetical protein